MKHSPNFSIMGIINVTPDSFSDGGSYLQTKDAIDHGLRLLAEGADILDFGAESARPYAHQTLNEQEEWRRLRDIIEYFAKNTTAPISLDSYKPYVIERCLDLGVTIINNIYGLLHPDCLKKIARNPTIKYLAMHMHQSPATMQDLPLTASMGPAVLDNFYKTTTETLLAAGFNPANIFLDPGIGFGKTDPCNIVLLRDLLKYTNQYNIVVGISRKSFMGRLLDIADPKERDKASKVIEFTLALAGVKWIRTHNVAALHQLRTKLALE